MNEARVARPGRGYRPAAESPFPAGAKLKRPDGNSLVTVAGAGALAG